MQKDKKVWSITNAADFWNIFYTTEVLALLMMVGSLDINIGHALI